MLRPICGGFSKKSLKRFSEVCLCLLVGSIVGGYN
jgi:hypothetical protein